MSDDSERRAEAVNRSLAFLEALDDPQVMFLHDETADAMRNYQEALEQHGVAAAEVLTQSVSVGVMVWLARHE